MKMEKVDGYLTIIKAYNVNLDDPLFDGCENVKDALQRIENMDIKEIADSEEVKQIFYEGFEIEIK